MGSWPVTIVIVPPMVWASRMRPPNSIFVGGTWLGAVRKRVKSKLRSTPFNSSGGKTSNAQPARTQQQSNSAWSQSFMACPEGLAATFTIRWQGDSKDGALGIASPWRASLAGRSIITESDEEGPSLQTGRWLEWGFAEELWQRLNRFGRRFPEKPGSIV